MRFKVGDRAKIRTDLKINERYGSQYFVKDMNQHKGEIAIITQVFDDEYFINLDHFYWADEMFEQVNIDLTISQLQSEIDKLSNEIGNYHNKIHSMRDRNNYMKEQLKELIKESKKEENKPILDDAEKEYLKNVIKPFKDKVEYIKKHSVLFDDKEYIYIGIKRKSDIFFPNFKKGTMYKGMELEKQYTLKELGLDE